MPEEPEQIGPLTFVPNPDYPYPFDVQKPPRFWMEEQSGTLAEAVERYMQGEVLSVDHRDLIKLYLRQYLERAVLGTNARRERLLARVDTLRSRQDIERFADDLSEIGVEPF